MGNDLTTSLERTLTLLGSPLTAAHVRGLIARSEHPGMVAEAVMASIPGPPPDPGSSRTDVFSPSSWTSGTRRHERSCGAERPARPAPSAHRRALNHGGPCAGIVRAIGRARGAAAGSPSAAAWRPSPAVGSLCTRAKAYALPRLAENGVSVAGRRGPVIDPAIS